MHKASGFKFASFKHARTYIRRVLLRDTKLKGNSISTKLNKLYKQVDFTKDYITRRDIHDILKDDNKGFLQLRALEKKGLISSIKTQNRVFYSLKDLEQEMLRRELCAYKDTQLFCKEYHEKTPRARKKLKRYYKEKEKVWMRINGQKWFAGIYPVYKAKKVERVIAWMYKHKELFNRKNKLFFNRRTFQKAFSKLVCSKLEDYTLEHIFGKYKCFKNVK